MNLLNEPESRVKAAVVAVVVIVIIIAGALIYLGGPRNGGTAAAPQQSSSSTIPPTVTVPAPSGNASGLAVLVNASSGSDYNASGLIVGAAADNGLVASLG
jgi:hypothetical protein